MRLDPVAIPCRACSAPPGRLCFVLTLHGACDDSVTPHAHGERIDDAAIVARILVAGGAAEAPVAATCRETWAGSPIAASCMHGYIWECPHGREREGGGMVGRVVG